MKRFLTSLFLSVAVAAAIPAAYAQIIYSGPTNVTISSATFPEAAPFKIDFNSDGIFDFDFFFRGPTPQQILVGGLNNGAYSGVASSLPDFITVGQSIDGSRTWWSPPLAGPLNLVFGSTPIGNFSGKRGYIGARFTAGTDIFYGWVDYAGNATTPTTGTIFGWAYESTPNRAIAAGAIGTTAVPESATYGAIAAGLALGLCVLRRWFTAPARMS